MLNVDFTFLWTALNLVVLFLFLRKFLFGRVGDFMDKRAAGIAADLEKAAADKAEGEQFKAEQQTLLQGATAERSRILDAARQKAATEYDSTIAQARQESARILEAAGAEVEREKEKMVNQMGNQVTSLALAAASKVMQANMDNEKNHKLVEDFLQSETGNTGGVA